VPVSAFYAEDPVRNVVRFCFSKSDATLLAALERLERVARTGPPSRTDSRTRLR